MKIYYNQSIFTEEQVTKKMVYRLWGEENGSDKIKSWVGRGVSFADLNDFDGCVSPEAEQLLENGKATYIITELDSDDDQYAYLGVTGLYSDLAPRKVDMRMNR